MTTLNLSPSFGSRPQTHAGPVGTSRSVQEALDLSQHIDAQLAQRGASREGNAATKYLDAQRQLEAKLQQLIGGGIWGRLQNFAEKVFGASAPSFEALSASKALNLDKPGMARVLSLPEHGATFSNPWVTSTRLAGNQGILNNPSQDRRKTDGTFHVTAYGQVTPFDKRETPVSVAAELLRHALQPPPELLGLPFTQDWKAPLAQFSTLYLRPTVIPEVPGRQPRQTMEILVAAPGNFISNIDFLERVFGHGGDPASLIGDAALDPKLWSGHSGLIIFAPHLVNLTKKELGLPHRSELSPDTNPEHARRIKDKMFWTDPQERYNNGDPFKLTTRGPQGVIIDILADNYYGYGKKTVKAHLSFAANLRGKAEEEHAGGAIAFSRYDLGEHYTAKNVTPRHEVDLLRSRTEGNWSFENAVKLLGTAFELKPEGYAVHKDRPDILLLPFNCRASLNDRTIIWQSQGKEVKLPLLPGSHYFLPSGYRMTFERGAATGQWRLMGTSAQGIFCHKPFTVSGGGKSEIAKWLGSLMTVKPLVLENFETDLERTKAVINYDFSKRFRAPSRVDDRPLLSPKRTLGSVIKLLSTSPEYTDEYNQFLIDIPPQVREFVQFVKRIYTSEIGERWPELFSVDVVDGKERRTLQYQGRPVQMKVVRVGYYADGTPRYSTLRDDFVSAVKLPREDDITASTIVDGKRYVDDVEVFHFQRPDGAKSHEDPATEKRFGGSEGLFISNYQIQNRDNLKDLLADPVSFEKFTPQMQRFLLTLQESNKETALFVTPNKARLLEDGTTSSNPRFLEIRPDLDDSFAEYIGDIAYKLQNGIPLQEVIAKPVDAILMGRRLNPPSPGIPSLAVYSPIHYQELPELFMDLIPSITGKGPSTVGFGKERALTKGPFNAMPSIVDLNNALVGLIISDEQVFSTAAGYVGPNYPVEHDVSMIIPEFWARMSPQERDANYLIREGLLEPIADFEYHGERLPAQRLGYRATSKFTQLIGGRIFNAPEAVFPNDWLYPETQNLDLFAEGLKAIVKAQKEAAEEFFKDGTIEGAVPPLKALLHIMRDGYYDTTIDGLAVRMEERDPRFREMFTKAHMEQSEWYQARLNAQHALDIARAVKAVEPLEKLIGERAFTDLGSARKNVLETRLAETRSSQREVFSSEYRAQLAGGIGLDPYARAIRAIDLK